MLPVCGCARCQIGDCFGQLQMTPDRRSYANLIGESFRRDAMKWDILRFCPVRNNFLNIRYIKIKHI